MKNRKIIATLLMALSTLCLAIGFSSCNFQLQDHEHVWNNYPKIKEDEICGCVYCLNIFKPSEIFDFTIEPDGGHTALCPYCDIDSVIGDSSGFPITKEFLKKMNEYWF